MPLRLVTGPANSGRAGEIMRAYRGRLAEGPILVVPALGDVDSLLRELADGGDVFGARVVRFSWLFETIAERCGLERAARASTLQRELLVERAITTARLRALSGSAARPGFVRAALRLVSELERTMVAPEVLERALSELGRARSPRAREVAALYAAYRDALADAGLVDDELFAWRALDALRERPHRFGRTPVFAYGFDDFTPLELDALETLATRADVDVTVSLPYERGRVAFKAIAPLFERLAGRAAEHVELPGSTSWYAPQARAELAHLERNLYEAPPPGAPPAGDALRLQVAGGERAEVELVAGSVLEVIRAGTAAGEIAVVFREPARYASLVEQVFGAYRIPYALERPVRLANTALGRGILALLRCATRDATADDLVAYLRTPGLVDYPRIVDRFEAELRTHGVTSVRAARGRWHGPLEALDRLRRTGRGEPLLAELAAQIDFLLAGASRRQAPIFAAGAVDDARVASAAQAAVAELAQLAERGTPLRFDARYVHDKLARLRVWLGEASLPDRVQVAAPESIRARRFDTVFVCGLQTAEFPRPPLAEPFLSDDERRELAAAGGLLLRRRDDEMDRERYLFYVCASRAERQLVLSTRSSDEAGNPSLRSSFVDDVVDLFGDGLERRARRRSLSEVTWPADQAPTEPERLRALAAAGPRREPTAPAGLDRERAVAADQSLSAGALETFADCPVKWLVERVLRPDQLEPDPEPLVRGSYAHEVLAETYRRLRDETGSARVTPATLARAERIALACLEERQSSFRISPRETRFRTAVRRLEFDVLRHLRREAEDDSDFEPEHLELAFGGPGDDLPPLRLEPEGVALRGRVDRIDVRGATAVVRDYKTGRRAYPVARWQKDNRLQVAVYMLAARELLGLDPVAGVYVPLAGPDPKPRGLLRSDAAAELGGGLAANDQRDGDEFEHELGLARERVSALAAQMRGGAVRPCPESCAWNGGCSYPSICRAEGRR